MLKKLIAEAIGTFLLVVVGCGAIIVNDATQGAVSHVGICLTFGAIVALMILCFGKISGCYINPAVTIAEWIRNKISAAQAALYIIAEIIGAIAGGFVLLLLSPDHKTLGSTLPTVPLWQTFSIEFIISAILFAFILFITHRTHNLGLIAVLIGSAVFILAYLAGPYTGASMNPARSIGPAVALGLWDELWLYILAPIMGMAIIAIFSHRKTLGA